jgi:anion-transporting  ArsA/GET3 family ATPase
MLWDDFLAARKKKLELQQRLEQLSHKVTDVQEQHDQKQQATFFKQFREKMEQVITPSFGKCVQSLNRYGIKAQQVNRMNRVHPNVSLDIRYNRQHYCMFLLSPMEAEGKVVLRTLIHKNNEWNYEDATRVDVEQLSESLIREKVQEAIDALDD